VFILFPSYVVVATVPSKRLHLSGFLEDRERRREDNLKFDVEC
jgi:hypothetical protein